MNFTTTEMSEISKKILEHVPDKEKESCRLELLKLDKELHDSRDRLRDLQKYEIITEILPVIFHKLKNKLTPIVGYCQILQTKVSDERQRDRIKKIEKNADELTDQFNSLRDYFPVEKTKKEQANLNNILSGLESYFSGIEKEHSLKIEIVKDPAVPGDSLNPAQLEILIARMIDNAVQAIKAKNSLKGVIKIKTKNEGDMYTLSIKDNGTGMSREDIPKIWTPFFSKFKGRPGIGLTVCEKIISNHDATFIVDSAAGEFSEFIIVFKKDSKPGKDNETGNFTKTHPGGSHK